MSNYTPGDRTPRVEREEEEARTRRKNQSGKSVENSANRVREEIEHAVPFVVYGGESKTFEEEERIYRPKRQPGSSGKH